MYIWLILGAVKTFCEPNFHIERVHHYVLVEAAAKRTLECIPICRNVQDIHVITRVVTIGPIWRVCEG